jgi:membrane-bound lytic murein transglycosylase MltF
MIPNKNQDVLMRKETPAYLLSLALACCLGISCSRSDNGEGGRSLTRNPEAVADGELLSIADLTAGSEQALSEIVGTSWTGDLPGMIERRVIRALVIPNKMSYFLDGVTQRGIAYEILTQLEEELNKSKKNRNLKVYVLIIPTTRDRVIADLLSGRGDIAATNLTPTPERSKHVDFIHPWTKDVSEVVVTGSSGPELQSLEDLAGQTVYIRKSSSYWEHLESLNDSFFGQSGLKPVKLKAADELLETEDILEMANAGLVKITVADDYLANFWAQIFSDIRVHSDISVHSGDQISWAIRKDSPELKHLLDPFVKKRQKGSLMGNILINRYLKDTSWVENSLTPEKLEQFDNTIALFEKYAESFGFDHLMITAQAYQESGLDHSKRSRAGAIGIMQLLESTASDANVGIQGIDQLENNIHAGVKYLRFLSDRYFSDPEITGVNRTLLSFAAYNAGPRRVANLRSKTEEMGLDPNKWFRNVEVAAAHEIGRETVQYVSNIYKYYVAYERVVTQQQLRANLKG